MDQANDDDDSPSPTSLHDPAAIEEVNSAVVSAKSATLSSGTFPDQSRQPSLDEERIKLAMELSEAECLLPAARLLRLVEDESLLSEQHREILEKAIEFERTVEDLISLPSEGWRKQGESHKNHDTIIYYKTDKKHSGKMTARIETPIEKSLLLPLISVFNESELYKTWMPSWNNIGISRSYMLETRGRTQQIMAVTANLPWPFSPREGILHCHPTDDIDAKGHIVCKMVSLNTGEEDGLIPPPENGVVRVDYDGGLMFRKCPADHPTLAKSKNQLSEGESRVLVCLTFTVDAHIAFVPMALINFFERTALGTAWASVLSVAEDVRDGKRPEHSKLIEEKREKIYDWIDHRVGIMLDGMDEPKDATEQNGTASST